jgi:hypothetical protein
MLELYTHAPEALTKKRERGYQRDQTNLRVVAACAHSFHTFAIVVGYPINRRYHPIAKIKSMCSLEHSAI